MSSARKLQAEIDRTLKKVDEGVALFDEIWDRVYSATHQSQKEKHEGELKKEIKKLQRFRDSIKSWASGNDVKDKRQLLEARRLIESKMEQFKVCEKETKTKAFSKEGLAQAARIDPAERKRKESRKYLQDQVQCLSDLVESAEADIESAQSSRSRRRGPSEEVEELEENIRNHKFHIEKLEIMTRLLDNKSLTVEDVETIKDDLEFYIESFEEEDFFVDMDMYESLDLETRIRGGSKLAKVEAEESKSKPMKTPKKKKKKKTSSSTMDTLLSISGRGGRKKTAASAPATPAKSKPKSVPKPVVPVKKVDGRSAAAVVAAGTKRSHAAKLAAQAEAQAARAREEALRQQKLAEQKRQHLLQQQQLEKRQAQAKEAEMRRQQQIKAKQEADAKAAAAHQAREQARQRVMHEREAQAKAKADALARESAATAARGHAARAADPTGFRTGGGGGAEAAAAAAARPSGDGAGAPGAGAGAGGKAYGGPGTGIGFGSKRASLELLSQSLMHIPEPHDSESSKDYTPRNPYPTHPSFPTAPAAVLQQPSLYEKFDPDTLFFVFYYQQGTYQQYLAAKELKKQSWRFHKKYSTWFQRYEEPAVTTDEYEQGTYAYFDYETGWCQRIKSGFTFEYNFLEDELAV